MAEFVDYGGGLTVPRVVLRDGMQIGSHPSCHLRLPYQGVLPVQAIVRCADGRYYLQDTGSGAIQVNSSPVREHMLQEGDLVSFFNGSLVYRFTEVGAAPARSDCHDDSDDVIGRFLHQVAASLRPRLQDPGPRWAFTGSCLVGLSTLLPVVNFSGFVVWWPGRYMLLLVFLSTVMALCAVGRGTSMVCMIFGVIFALFCLIALVSGIEIGGLQIGVGLGIILALLGSSLAVYGCSLRIRMGDH